jgi:hypothetical protein
MFKAIYKTGWKIIDDAAARAGSSVYTFFKY